MIVFLYQGLSIEKNNCSKHGCPKFPPHSSLLFRWFESPYLDLISCFVEIPHCLEHVWFFNILGMSSSQLLLTHIFQRGRYTTNQIYIYIYTCHIIRSIKSPSSSWEFLHVLNVLYGFFTRCVQVFRGHTVGSLGIWEKTMKTYKMVISWDFMGFNETYMDLYGIYSWFLIGISWCLTPISLWTTMVSVGDTVYRTN